MAESHAGLLVVFEGIDGAGTTTQCENYAAYLRGVERPSFVTHQPSSGPVGSLLRQGLTQRVELGGAATMALLFAADRLDHLHHTVAPHLVRGEVVCCDRYDLSSIAYQSATADGESDFADWVRTLNRHARRPDVTVVLDVEPEVAASRRARRRQAAELYEEDVIQRRLAALYENAETLVPGDRIVHIDGNGPLATVEHAVREALRPFVFGAAPPP
ncbi:MAG: dTMP kinase [Myxococcota bacterium]